VDTRRLPTHPDLDQYKKQAKDLLKQLQSGVPDAVRRLQQSHPRFKGLSDANARIAACVLADAQLVVAREHGFSSWAAFKRRIQVSARALEDAVSRRGAAPSNDGVRELLLRQRVGDPLGAGLVVGLVDAHGRRVVTLDTSRADAKASDGDTLFGASLATLPFTALLLADMVQDGGMAWTDPVSMHLPAGVTVPQRHGRSITLLDLALHRSGLPVLPPGFQGRPFADLTVENLYAFLATYELSRDIDAKTEISLVGYGLLGLALAYRACEDFSTLLRRRVLAPLEMRETRLAGDGPLDSAVGLRSTVREILKFLGAMLGHTGSLLTATIQQLQRTRDPRGRERRIGWMTFSVDGVFMPGGRDIMWVDGMLGGDRTFVGFAPRDGIGVVTVAIGSVRPGGLARLNAAQNLGLHLLDPRWPALDTPVAT